MAPRWKLVAPHYMYVEGQSIEWEYKEVDRKTGRQKTTKFRVPMFLDPKEPGDWTHRLNNDEGEIYVAYAGSDDSRDIIFQGDPTPDMVPANEEARKLSATFEKKWHHPIDSLPTTYGDKILEGLQAEVSQIRAQTEAPTNNQGVTEILGAMSAMMKQNQELMAMLAAQAKPAERRV